MMELLHGLYLLLVLLGDIAMALCGLVMLCICAWLGWVLLVAFLLFAKWLALWPYRALTNNPH